MNYTPKLYARAFHDVLKETRSEKEKSRALKNLVALVERNGDARHWDAIVEETETMIREARGQRKVTLETARQIADIKKRCGSLLKKSDIVEQKINPELVAGVRITINDELQLDGSMARELTKLFA